MLAVAGCGAQVESTFVVIAHTPDATATGEAHTLPDFDVALVQSNFTAECEDPIVVDDLFCQQVKISEMTGEGRKLIVPTGLNPPSTDRAAAVCNQVAEAHYDGDTGHDLGYTAIEVLDLDGGSAATCHTA
jgi:hypothetical protein